MHIPDSENGVILRVGAVQIGIGEEQSRDAAGS